MSKIEWTEKTWNVSTGCNKVSEGCKHCYAEVMHKRQMVLNPEKYAHPFLDSAFPHEASLEAPLHWKKPAMIFVNSMSDLFHENIKMDYIARVFAIMFLCEQHTFQVLTKRAERLQWLNEDIFIKWVYKYANLYHDKFIKPLESEMYFDDEMKSMWPLKNVWIGTSVENQEQADKRIPYLLQIPAAVRFLSCEPLLGEVDLAEYMWPTCWHWPAKYKSLKEAIADGAAEKRPQGLVLAGSRFLDWVIVGGESGHGARPMHPDWARKIRDDCQAAGVAFFFKQWGNLLPVSQASGKEFPHNLVKCYMHNAKLANYYKLGKKHTGRLLDGVEYSEYPKNEIAKGK